MRLKVIIPLAVIAIIGLSIFGWFTYSALISRQQKLVNALVDASSTLTNSGNYTGAIKNFDKALAIDPKNVVALAGKAYALYNLGNHTQAINYYHKALDINPNDANLLNLYSNTLYRSGNNTQALIYIDKVYAQSSIILH